MTPPCCMNKTSERNKLQVFHLSHKLVPMVEVSQKAMDNILWINGNKYSTGEFERNILFLSFIYLLLQ